MIAPGDRLPDGTFKVKADDGSAADVSVAELFDGQKVVLVGVPGAFTSTCHNSHAPQFVTHGAEMRARGVDRIAVMAVNDHHVMRAWAEALDAVGKIDVLADGSALYTKALGLELDLTGAGMGLRCRRFSALIEDRVVKTLNFEEQGASGIHATGAATILGQL